MPNHVTNEVIFRNVDRAMQDSLLLSLCDGDELVDFSILLPIPINVWRGNVGRAHRETFPDNSLDWCRENWGTKWNAYRREPIVRGEDTLTLTFDTAWRTPYGWLMAVFNKFHIPFEYNSLSEGEMRSRSGKFWIAYEDDNWNETESGDATHRHMHMLRWGVEEFSEERGGVMADTKQATAEAVCEKCGQSRSAHRWLMAWCSGEPGDGRRFTPRTQPSQTALRIPDDLKLDWETLNAPYLKPVTLEWAIERDMSMQQFAKKLIERIARLEGGGRG